MPCPLKGDGGFITNYVFIVMGKDKNKDKNKENKKISFNKDVEVGFITDSPGIKAEADYGLLDTPSDKDTRKFNKYLRNSVLMDAIGAPPIAEDGEPSFKRDSNTRKDKAGKPIKADLSNKELIKNRWDGASDLSTGNDAKMSSPQRESNKVEKDEPKRKAPARQSSDKVPKAPARRRPSIELDAEGESKREAPVRQSSDKMPKAPARRRPSIEQEQKQDWADSILGEKSKGKDGGIER